MNEFENTPFEEPKADSVSENEDAAAEGSEIPQEQPQDIPEQPPVQAPPPIYGQNPYTQYPTPVNPQYNAPVRFTDIGKAADSGVSRGLKIFCIVFAAMILLTGSVLAGFIIGKKQSNSISPSDLYSDVKLDLAAKPENTDPYTPAQIYEKLNKSIVGIRVYNENGKMSDASGVVYTEDGYIVTNDHIYSSIGAPKFKVYMYDGNEYNAKYVAGDAVSDLAVLKIIDGEDFEPAVFGNSNELFCGENVVALGRPSSAPDATTITSGIISMTSRRVSNNTNYSARLIQTDSAINPGSSGGALVNMYGQVVGITSSKLAGTQYDAICFAIPTTTMERVVTQLISKGKVNDRAKLGITYTEINSVSAEILDSKAIGIYVATVSQDSELYGKVAEGDIITKINGADITADDIVLDVIEECKAGDSVTVTVYHTDGNTAEYTVKLGANIGESSYSEVLETEDDSSASGGTFDFPYGE